MNTHTHTHFTQPGKQPRQGGERRLFSLMVLSFRDLLVLVVGAEQGRHHLSCWIFGLACSAAESGSHRSEQDGQPDRETARNRFRSAALLPFLFPLS